MKLQPCSRKDSENTLLKNKFNLNTILARNNKAETYILCFYYLQIKFLNYLTP